MNLPPSGLLCGVVILVVMLACWLGNRKWIVVDVIIGILCGLLFLVVVGPILVHVFLK